MGVFNSRVVRLKTHGGLLAFGLGLVVLVFSTPGLADESPAASANDPAATAGPTSTADHSKFDELAGPFTSGPEVTRACLGCHTEAAAQVHDSIHWTWEYIHPDTGQRLGKKYLVNSYCGSLTANYPRCTSCHVGFGWKDADFDFDSAENVDCMVCHDTTGSYVKFPTAAGHPPYQDKKFGNKLIKAPDLAKVAQSVGKTSRASCGSCHFKGGGGDAVKHGDLDSTMTNPPRALDVHMDADGLDFSCSTCHEFIEHKQAGSRYKVRAKSEGGIAVPGRESTRPSCESCHGRAPHPREVNNKLNDHVAKVACQTCHIPAFARGGKATKTWWDWSTAGRLKPDGKPVVEKKDGNVVYHGKKGSFEWQADVVPDYLWFDGKVRYTLLGDDIEPAEVVEINRVEGSADDPDSRIWPFKIMRGRQAFDAGNNTLVIGHLFGKDDAAYWKSFDWNKAVATAMAEAKAIGQTDKDYSGELGWVETAMYWPLAHMVAPAEDSLQCDDCHSRDGRMAGIEGVYVPGRDANFWIDRIGWLLVGATLVGVGIHGLMRVLFARRRNGRA